MSVCYAIPSARPMEEAEPILKKWLAQGYKIFLWRDKPKPGDYSEIDWCRRLGMTATWAADYPGYAVAVNQMCMRILAVDPEADWIVTGGDDVEPDPNKRADEIAAECSAHFRLDYWKRQLASTIDPSYTEPPNVPSYTELQNISTFGVMQPTGDDWSDFHEGKRSRIIERIAGSPWMGREFCLRMNGGQGPLWPEYTHCFEDEELQLVAQKLGVFWQRPDLTHFHHHWMRAEHPSVPPHLREATSKAHWNKFKALFEQRKAAGFPGHEPIR